MNASRAVLRTATEEHPSVVYESFVLGKRDIYVKAAFLKLGSHEDAREVANVALFKIFKHWDDALASESTAAFGMKILRNEIADTLRKRDRRPCSPAGLAFEPTVRPFAGMANEDIDQVAIRMELHQAIGRLPARQRECVTQHYLLGYDVADVADALGLSDSTVRTHLASGCRALAKALDVPDDDFADEKGPSS
ncbi:sigma-70 family RNA polymerase sigma factor [Streptomyces sp. H10-C2]|uniref:RNA polymerase sigma factor n=1 Tax=unclassified Streptomyces TaxID=2593676 RepID=UPI0024BA5029|nr:MULTISPECIES: sigma-70 family RNA polymerase sigma factor [unclassified Streptomyces]MDJ0347433.1 sigma-70 family RNA polymerase sigma factor [Streptomyces sp. PH10-H1]MDJ0374798.1 sigma-70 family RNA polymerase sigma factor [Streptomyces sp. H10-C2]